MPWLTYERENGEWTPVIHYGDRPPMFIPDQGRTEPVEIPAEYIGGDGEPMLGRLRKRFLAPEKRR